MAHQKTYLVYDGVVYASDTPLIKSTNRAFRYGDGLFETIHFHKGSPLFFGNHYERLLRGMAVLQMAIQGFPSRQELTERIISLVNKNRFFGDVRVRLTVFRRGEGLYTPQESKASWLIEMSEMSHQGYPLNEKGLMVDVFTGFPKQASPVSSFKTTGSLPYVMTGLYCKEQQLDDCLLVNGHGRIIESISSNLFLIKEQTVYTPGIGSGCIDGVLRNQIISFLPDLGLRVVETAGASHSDLMEADEIFLTNTIQGIRWVLGMGDKRFFGIQVRKIQRHLAGLLPIS